MVSAMTLILWGIFVLLTAIEYIPLCKDLSFGKTLIVILICLAGPVFALNSILVEILDSILPEGWDDE